MTRREYLETAGKIVTEDRNRQYGDPEDNFGVIARYWATYLEIPVTAMDVAVMMNLFKIGRITTGPTVDSFVDAIGYMACAGELYSRQRDSEVEMAADD